MWIRPLAWTKVPLDPGEDVAFLIVQALMCEGIGNVRELRAFALVNRACASATAATLRLTCVQLRALSSKVVQAENRLHAYVRRHITTSESATDSDSSDSSENGSVAILLEGRRSDFVSHMALVGIPLSRRLALGKLPGRVWFQDNRSLLGHLNNGCELCGSSLNIRFPVIESPVTLFACLTCRSKNCTRLSLEFSKHSRCNNRLVARVDLHETESNDYACALFSKQAAHRRRMCSKRTGMLASTNLAKRVHEVTFTDELHLCYAKSESQMSSAPWAIELWHRLPTGIPQHMTFGEVMGVRDSDLVREETFRESKRRRGVRSRATRKSAALSRLLRKYEASRVHVWRVVRKGHFDGWMQAIEICATACALETRWMFRTGAYTADFKTARYKLLDIEERALDVATRRVSSVAQVIHWLGGVMSRNTILRLMRNFPPVFLEGSTACVHALVRVLYVATVGLRIIAETTQHQTLEVVYYVGHPFSRGTLCVHSSFSKYTVQRLGMVMGMNFGEGLFTNEMVHTIQNMANRGMDEARGALFSMPGRWPTWITDEAPNLTLHQLFVTG